MNTLYLEPSDSSFNGSFAPFVFTNSDWVALGVKNDSGHVDTYFVRGDLSFTDDIISGSCDLAYLYSWGSGVWSVLDYDSVQINLSGKSPLCVYSSFENTSRLGDYVNWKENQSQNLITACLLCCVLACCLVCSFHALFK